MSTTSLLLSGAIAMQYAVAALFFLRYRKMTDDRLFGYFAIAFALLGAERIAGVYFATEHTAALIYLIRLVAFAVIAWAILSKNRGVNRQS